MMHVSDAAGSISPARCVTFLPLARPPAIVTIMTDAPSAPPRIVVWSDYI